MDLSDDDVTAKRGCGAGNRGGSSSSKPPQSNAMVLLTSNQLRKHAKVCRKTQCSQCSYHKQQARLESQTPMLAPSYDVLSLSAEQQLLARGSWLQPAICNGKFGWGPGFRNPAFHARSARRFPPFLVLGRFHLSGVASAGGEASAAGHVRQWGSVPVTVSLVSATIRGNLHRRCAGGACRGIQSPPSTSRPFINSWVCKRTQPLGGTVWEARKRWNSMRCLKSCSQGERRTMAEARRPK